MNRTALTLSLVFLGIAALLAYLTLFTVSQTQQALLLEFGRPKRVITEPGLQYKIPFIQNVVFFDKRILDIDTASQEVIASDQKRLVVDAFARYKIVNSLLFFQSVANEEGANSRLGAVLESSLRRVLGAASFATVVRDQREQLMRTILGQVNKEAGPFGINVVDVRIKRIDLPDEVSESVYKRMRAERSQLANELRFTGQEAAEKIKADADRQGLVLRADARRDATKVRGEGDAEAAAVYAAAYNQDPEFFAFYRSMAAYRKSFEDGKGVLVLKPDSEFLKYFNDATPKR